MLQIASEVNRCLLMETGGLKIAVLSAILFKVTQEVKGDLLPTTCTVLLKEPLPIRENIECA